VKDGRALITLATMIGVLSLVSMMVEVPVAVKPLKKGGFQ